MGESSDRQSLLFESFFLKRRVLAVDIIERRGTDPLLKFLQNLGGWPVVESNWNASTFDMEKLVATLRNMHNDILISLVS
jgi:Peptidase family M13